LEGLDSIPEVEKRDAQVTWDHHAPRDYHHERLQKEKHMTTPGIYCHYKGNLYRVLFLVQDSENDSTEPDRWMVVYVSLSEPGRLSVRPEKEFSSLVRQEESAVSDAVTHRFQRIGD
jgi:hypothetical protein